MRHYSEFGYVIDRSIWLTPSEFAKHYGCGVQTLYNKKVSGDLPEDFLLTDGWHWYIHKDATMPFSKRKRA